MARTLRSKRLRALLWYAADGKCQLCGCDLPDGWHADHIVPFVVSGRTNVHEMQATCPACNLKKGSSGMQGFMGLRRHQQEMRDVCREILGGNPVRRIICGVTPGGGKSLLPQILAAELIPKVVDKIAWVVPRESLQVQADQGFEKDDNRRAVGCAMKICRSTNDYDPSRGTNGFVTTIQAVGVDKESTVSKEFDRNRYALFIDECHHVEVGSHWHKALISLVEKAAISVFMSGNLGRGDMGQIAFLNYDFVDGKWVLNLENSVDQFVIRYSRQDAIEEKAVIPMHLHHLDTKAEWIDRNGKPRKADSFDEPKEKESDILWTALSTGFAFSLLDRAVAHWRGHRLCNRRSKMLIVAANIKSAKTYIKHLRDVGLKAGIATSEKPEEAKDQIKKFKLVKELDRLDVLVTVGMAYEGLDVPSITHIACLTHIRTYQWIEQMVNRATRYDPEAGPWESQFAYIFVPDDKAMRDVLGKMKAEEIEALAAMDLDSTPIERDGSPRDDREGISPLASLVTRQRSSDLQGGETDYEETERIVDAMEEFGIHGVSPIQFKGAMLKMQEESSPIRGNDELIVTDTDRRLKIRNSIQSHCARYDKQKGWDYGESNGRVKGQFQKPRDLMTLPELIKCWTWVQRNFVLTEVSECVQ